jgi:hypothetical protein
MPPRPKKQRRIRIGYRKLSLTDVDGILDKFFGSRGYRDERPMTMTQKQCDGQKRTR